MSSKKLQILIIVFAGIFVLVGILVFLNFDSIKKIGADLGIWSAALKYPVLGDGGIGGCGNSIVEENLGEECDDGNSLAEDGCSPSCQWENVSIAYSWCGTTSCPVGRIYSQDGSDYKKQFWHVVPLAYVEIADIGNPTEVARIKNITDGQPKGFRAVINFFYPRWSDYINTIGDKDNIIVPGSCTNPNDLSTCQKIQDVPMPPGCSAPYITVDGYAINYRSPWWNNWVAENQTRLTTFLNDYIGMGGKEINYFLSDYERGFDVGFAKPWPASLIPSGDNSDTPCNESLYYSAYNERVEAWWNGIQNDPRFSAMQSRLAQYGFVIPQGQTLYEYINPWTYEWTRPATTNVQLMWNSVQQDMVAEYLNQAYYNTLKSYYPNVQMTDNANFMHSSAYPIQGLLWPYGTGVKVGTHQDTATFENITFSSFKQGVNGVRASALAAPSVPLRVWLSHWSFGLQSPYNQTFNLNYAKYWTENIFHVLLSGSDGISWFNSSGNGEDQDTRATADRTAESTAMNTLLQEFDSLTYFRQDRTTLVTNLIGDNTNYILTGMRVPNHYNLYRLTPNQDGGQTAQILQRNPAIFLVNNTTRILIPGGEIYTPVNNVAPYGYWIIQPLNAGNPIVETGTCVNTCVDESCTNDCTAGQTKCSDTSNKQTCGQYDQDTCLEWSSAQVCSGSTACGYGTCSATQKPTWRCENGTCSYTCANDTSCSTTCANECISGQAKCSDTTHKQTCGQYDQDTCLEWSTATICSESTACGYGTCPDTHKPSWRCDNGTCSYLCNNSSACTGEPAEQPQTCSDECSTGQTKCSDASHKQTCGQYDQDTCLEWSSAQVCSGSTACGYGTCSATQKPSWSCKDGKCVYVCASSTACKSDQAYIKNYKKECYNDNIYWYDSTGQIQSIYEKCEDSCANASCVDSNSAAAASTANIDDSENVEPPAPEITEAEKEQPFLDSIIQFITSHILLTVIIVVTAYLVFAVAGYALFKRLT